MKTRQSKYTFALIIHSEVKTKPESSVVQLLLE